MGGKIARAVFLLGLLALVLGAAAAWWGYAKFMQPGPLRAETTVIIQRGSGFSGIADALARSGVISDPFIFRYGARLLGADKALRAGEYAFAAGASPREVVELMQSGRTVIRRLTIAEGLATAQILAQLQATEGLDGDAVDANQETPPFKEGALLPETYHFSYGDKRSGLLKRMAAAMSQELSALWSARANGLPFKTPQEAVILASIIEKETSRADERARIAGVFINRLNKGMRLQSDPTVVYGLTKGKAALGRPLSRADLKKPTPYNTYLIQGLPPSPICNPGKDSLAAALDPEKTEDLYFVADGSGGHVFARTLEEHGKNVARWRKHNKHMKQNAAQ